MRADLPEIRKLGTEAYFSAEPTKGVVAYHVALAGKQIEFTQEEIQERMDRYLDGVRVDAQGKVTIDPRP